MEVFSGPDSILKMRNLRIEQTHTCPGQPPPSTHYEHVCGSGTLWSTLSRNSFTCKCTCICVSTYRSAGIISIYTSELETATLLLSVVISQGFLRIVALDSLGFSCYIEPISHKRANCCSVDGLTLTSSGMTRLLGIWSVLPCSMSSLSSARR